MICDDLFIFEVKLKLCSMFQIFKMATILRSRQTYLLVVISEVEYTNKIDEHLQYFELVIDALAEILMEI